MNVVQKEAECMEAQANSKKSEALVRQMELMLKKERYLIETNLEKVKREARQSEDRALELQANLDRLKQSHVQEKADEAFAKKEARFDKTEWEDKLSQLMKENSQLAAQIEDLTERLNKQGMDESNEVLQLKRELAASQSYLEECGEKENLTKVRLSEASSDKINLSKAESDLEAAKNEIERLRDELMQNEEAVIERKAMRQKLDHYPKVVRENEALRAENQLLHDTAENCALLKTKANDLEQKLTKAESLVEIGQTAKEQLLQAKREVQRWQGVCLHILTPEERSKVAETNVGIDILKQKIAEFQQNP